MTREVFKGVCVLAVVAGMAGVHAPVWAQKGTQSCKLQSQKVVQGREKRCIYVCQDKTLEGRSRKLDSDCPSHITSARH